MKFYFSFISKIEKGTFMFWEKIKKPKVHLTIFATCILLIIFAWLSS